MRRNINDPAIDNSQIGLNDAMGRCYEGKKKAKRVCQMGFVKKSSVISLLKPSMFVVRRKI